MKDEVFSEKIIKQFEFDEKVVRVFDDMVTRSVPFYKQNEKILCDILFKNAKENAKILDIGCSTANTLIALANKKDYELFGLDSSKCMIDKASIKAKDLNINITFIHDEIENLDKINTSFDVIICAYTLHFIRPLKRQEILEKIYKKLNNNSIFILCEKVLFENNTFQKNIIDIYEDYKESMGYSRYEIAQKRAALENVLIPFTYNENVKILSNAGFKHIDSFFRWANFASFIAFKE